MSLLPVIRAISFGQCYSGSVIQAVSFGQLFFYPENNRESVSTSQALPSTRLAVKAILANRIQVVAELRMLGRPPRRAGVRSRCALWARLGIDWVARRFLVDFTSVVCDERKTSVSYSFADERNGYAHEILLSDGYTNYEGHITITTKARSQHYAYKHRVGSPTSQQRGPMPSNRLNQLSKFLSFVLRHKPEEIGLTLDPNGWAFVDDLIAKSNKNGTRICLDELIQVVETNDKKRFSLSEDRTRIRAAQGHSVSVDLNLPPSQPPDVLYHGTATRFVAQIMSDGLKPKSRQHVHLSLNVDTARSVGARHGRPVVLRVDSQGMNAAGFLFYLADNGVWLTDHVPPEFLCLAPK